MIENINIYAGVGSRHTPDNIAKVMYKIGLQLAREGALLRSGGAKGADTAFEKGCDEMEGFKEIFLPDDATPSAIDLARRFHPAWNRCSEFAKKAHGRNAMILLGRNCASPVFFQPVQAVICWTRDGKDTGGTGQAIRMAKNYGIPVYNLFYTEVLESINKRFDYK